MEVNLGFSQVLVSCILLLLQGKPSVQMANDSITVRPASADDLDALTAIGLAALPDDPVWPYRYPFAAQFPDDHYKYSRIRYSEYLANVDAGAYAVMVAESPIDQDPDVKEIVAMSMWQLPGTHGVDPNGPTEIQKAMKPPGDYSDRRDASPVRMKAFRSSIGTNKKKVFDAQYGEQQLNLMVLATKPEYQRRGAGGALVQWGIDKAKQDGLTVTLFSSPQGYGLYKKLGFADVGVASVQAEGEDLVLTLPMMVC